MANETASIKSVETLLQILEFMKGRDGVTIKECAEELDLANSTVHKHLATVKDARLVVQEGTEYRMGLGFLSYGVTVRNLFPIYDLAQHAMDELAEQTGERVWLKVEEDGVEVPIAKHGGEHAIKTDRDIGHPNKLHKTAGGKAILAHLPNERREELITSINLDANTEYTITDKSELQSELETIQEKGVAYNKSEDIIGVNAVGAPVIDNKQTLYGAIVIAGPENRLTDEWMEGELSALVKGTANELGINISYQS